MSETANAAGEPLVMFVIYKHPGDYPNDFVVRRAFVMPGEENPWFEAAPYYIDRTLEDVRKQIPHGFVMLNRCPDDEPQIVETWL